MRTSSRNVALLLFDEVELLDVSGPMAALSAAGRQWNFRPFKLHPVAKRAGLVETRSQIRLEARFDYPGCPLPEVVVLPGGYGARRALADAETVEFVERISATAEFILAVGAGVLLAGRAGVTRGATVSVSREHRELFEEHCAGALATEDAFCDAGRLMTTSRSAGALQLSLDLVRKVLGAKLAAQVAASLGCEPAPAVAPAAEILRVIRRDTTG